MGGSFSSGNTVFNFFDITQEDNPALQQARLADAQAGVEEVEVALLIVILLLTGSQIPTNPHIWFRR